MAKNHAADGILPVMKTVFQLLLALIVLCALALGSTYFYARQSLPQTEGRIRLAGLGKPVEIVRDVYGVPHIYAASHADAYFALGFAHAQDRLWQMEMSRRIGAGRLAEILGPAALDTDRFLRTLGVRRAAQASLERLNDETRRILDAYAAGVNAFLATDPVLPPEFLILRVRPESWASVDSVAWTKMMAWDLGRNFRDELLRVRLLKTMPLARVQEFLPPYPGDAPLEIADLRALYSALEDTALRLARIAPESAGSASNNWVVASAHSASGRPLLANDPHLGLTAPPVWYFAHLSAPGLEVIGATLPGVPAIVLGRNSRFAWGFTNTGPDVQDLYLEKLVSEQQYLAPQGPRDFTLIEETIKVKGAPDEKLTVRVSRHGPVISDALRGAREAAPGGYVLALAWTALAEDDRTMQASSKLAHTHDWRSFLEAARDFHAPQQNIVYADIEGNIGFIAAGRVPVRKPENNVMGLAPAPGWVARYDWDGYVPFDELPHAYNPASGMLYTANEKIVPPGYRHFITSEWEPPYRAGRIRELLEAEPKHSVNSFARMQMDVVSPAARELLPHLLKTRGWSEEAERALEQLAKWDGAMAAARPEPLIFAAWWRELARAIYADELGGAFEQHWETRAVFMGNVLANRAGQARWCDDLRTPATETCEEMLSRSLEAALGELRRRYGANPDRWRWDEAHMARHEHRPFGTKRELARWFDIRVPSAGGDYTLNRGRMKFANQEEPFASRHASSLRAIYDLSNLDASLYIHSGGQSGNRLSPHYQSFSEAWAKGEYIQMTTDRKLIESRGAQRLVLQP
jgi:penicillin G amidase